MKGVSVLIILLECSIILLGSGAFISIHKNIATTNIIKNITETILKKLDCSTIVIVDVNCTLKKVEINLKPNAVMFYNDKQNISLSEFNMLEIFYFFVIESITHPIDKLIGEYYHWANYAAESLSIIYITKVTAKQGKSNGEWLSSLFKLCWTRNITKVLIYYWSEKHESLQWYNYNVFTNTLVNRTGDWKLREYWSDMHTNFHGYALPVCFYNILPFSLILKNETNDKIYAGIDGFAMKAILKQLNASYTIIEANNTHESRLMKSRRAIENRTCDILFTSQYIINNPRIRYLYPIKRDAWCILVPKASKKNAVLKLITPWSSKVWLSFIICTNIIFIIWYTFFKIASFHLNKEDKRLIFLDLLSILLNISISPNIAKLSTSVKTFVMTLVTYNFFVSFSYLGLLYGSLMTPLYHKDMHTLQDVRISGLKVLVHEPEYKIWLETGLDVHRNGLNEVFLPEKNMSKILEKQENNAIDYGYAVRERSASFIVGLNSHYRGNRPVYHLVEECFLPIYVSYAVALDFPFSKRIERLIRRIQEAGLTRFWDLVSKYEYIRLTTQRKAISEDQTLTALTMADFVGIFYAWSISLLLCTIVFILEIISNSVRLSGSP